jgi:hypothetical protein
LSDAAGELRGQIAAYWKPHAIACAARLGIADAMDGTMTAPELAARLGLHPEALARFLRALAAIGLTRDEGDGRFSLTDRGAALRADHPQSLKGMALHMANDLSPAFARLDQTVRTGLPPEGIAYGPDGFAQFEHDENSAAVFNQAMVDNSRRFGAEAARAYDFTRFATIADVGGGYGAVLAELLKAAPAASGWVLDLAHAKAGAERLFAAEGVAERARFVEASFFDPLPIVADCYVLKYILHDWDDAQAARIVARVGEAARGSGGTVILIEKLMPERVADDPAHAVALQGDMTMMLWNGKERTEREFAALFAGGGLSLTRTLALPDNHFVIEAVPDG